jgi:hypothetical protein
VIETSELIRNLAANPRPRGPALSAGLLGLAGLALAYGAVAILTLRGLRPDFAEAWTWVAGKAGLSLALGALGLWATLRAGRPGSSLVAATGAWVGLVVLSLAAAASGAMSAPSSERLQVMTGGDFPHCTVIIPALAAPAGAAFFLWLRRAAPTRLWLAGAAAGGLAGALAAAAYALACPVDTVAFVALWYPLSIAICVALGAVAGSAFLRW